MYCVCHVCVCVWRSENNFQVSSSSTMWIIGIESGPLAWHQAPLPTEPSCQPFYSDFRVLPCHLPPPFLPPRGSHVFQIQIHCVVSADPPASVRWELDYRCVSSHLSPSLALKPGASRILGKCSATRATSPSCLLFLPLPLSLPTFLSVYQTYLEHSMQPWLISNSSLLGLPSSGITSLCPQVLLPQCCWNGITFSIFC